jgi:hypothetical protein
MLDYNTRETFADKINARIDTALTGAECQKTPRDYLGASRLGVECDRALQHEFLNTPKDDEREFSGKTLRIFAAGHVFEDLAIDWLRLAGFELYTEKKNGAQFGFSVAGGRVKGHVDGIIANGPQELNLSYPMLWECKSLNNKSWNDTLKKGVVLSKPVYAAQMALYQAYMEGTTQGLSQNPALFTAINKDTAELHHELVPFDGGLDQKMSDRAVKILKATDNHECLPRISKTPTFYVCKFCDWQDRCWKEKA